LQRPSMTLRRASVDSGRRLLFNQAPMRCRAYSAEWILPMTSPAVHKGVVLVEDDRIRFAGKESDAPGDFESCEVVDFGLAAILPGFVNVHTHLELTVMRGYLEDLAFRDWIVKLTHAKYELLTAEDLMRSALLGAAEAIRSGITTAADTGDSGSAFEALL